MSEREKWMTAKEMCEYLSVSRSTLYRYIHMGMPASRIGRYWRFRAEDVDRWIKQGGGDQEKQSNQ